MRTWLWAVGLSLGLQACDSRFSLPDEGPGRPPPPAPLSARREGVSLLSAVGLQDGVRLEWVLSQATPTDLQLQAWIATPGQDPRSGSAYALDTEQLSAVIDGLDSDTEYIAQLAGRRGSGSFELLGLPLRFRVADPIYVNPNFAPSFGDGTTPATAYGDLLLAVVVAFGNGGGNVWVSEGNLDAVSLPLFSGVHLYGGFAADFDPEERDASANEVLLRGAAGSPIVQLNAGAVGLGILDGFTLDGLGVASEGVQNTGIECELRQLQIRDCQRGMRLRTTAGSGTLPLSLSGVQVEGSGLEGISLDGAFDLSLDRCAFSLNTAEGLDLDALQCPEDETAKLRIMNSRFDRNGAEGMDLHLAVPLGSGTLGGDFDVEIIDCDFELNALDGARLDIDYEANPQWRSRFVLRGLRARANAGAGLHFDLDSNAVTLVARSVCSANGAEGLRFSSESAPGLASAHGCCFMANRTYGVRTDFGQVSALLSSCVFSGNQLGAMRSEVVPSTVHESVLYLESPTLTGVTRVDCLVANQADPDLFENAAQAYSTVTAANGAILTLEDALAGLWLHGELADDGIARSLQWSAPGQVEASPAPTAPVGSILALFEAADVQEDWRTPLGSPAEDLGPFGGVPAGIPGREEALAQDLFWLADSAPRPQTSVASNQTWTLSFEGGVPAAGAGAFVRVRRSNGNTLALNAFVIGSTLRIDPPAGGWQNGDVLLLLEGFSASNGRVLVGPWAWPVRLL